MHFMKMFSVLSFLCFSLSTFAAKDVELNSKNIFLGDLGDIRRAQDVQVNGDFALVRSEKTPAKVDLQFSAQHPELVCARQVVDTYPCGCYNGGGYGGGYPYPGGYNPRPPHGSPYPGGYYPGQYPGGYGPGYGCGMCQNVRCLEYKEVLVTRSHEVKLNFKKAIKLAGNDIENFDLKVRSTGRSLENEVTAPNFYKVKKLGNRYKFKKN